MSEIDVFEKTDVPESGGPLSQDPGKLYDRLLDAAAEQDGELSALLLSAANRIGADHG